MSQIWHVSRDGRQEGPFEWVQLQKLAAENQIAPGDYVWTDGFADWVTASSVQDLFGSTDATTSIPATLAVAPMVATPAANFSGVPILDYRTFRQGPARYAGFWVRFAASFIDGLIILAIGVPLTVAFVWYIGSDAAKANGHTVTNFVRIIFITIGWIYCCTLESGSQQSTIGKRMCGLRVTDIMGNQISFARATGRHFGKIISQLILCIGYLMMLFTPNSQCLHDLMSGCVVVKREWN